MKPRRISFSTVASRSDHIQNTNRKHEPAISKDNFFSLVGQHHKDWRVIKIEYIHSKSEQLLNPLSESLQRLHDDRTKDHLTQLIRSFHLIRLNLSIPINLMPVPHKK